MFPLDCVFLFQGLHGDSGLVPAGQLLLVRPRPQHRRRLETCCHLWTQKCGAGAAGLRGNWATEISSPGLDTQIHTHLMYPRLYKYIFFYINRNKQKICTKESNFKKQSVCPATDLEVQSLLAPCENFMQSWSR